jgi:hypothetical protein
MDDVIDRRFPMETLARVSIVSRMAGMSDYRQLMLDGFEQFSGDDAALLMAGLAQRLGR